MSGEGRGGRSSQVGGRGDEGSQSVPGALQLMGGGAVGASVCPGVDLQIGGGVRGKDVRALQGRSSTGTHLSGNHYRTTLHPAYFLTLICPHLSIHTLQATGPARNFCRLLALQPPPDAVTARLPRAPGAGEGPAGSAQGGRQREATEGGRRQQRGTTGKVGIRTARAPHPPWGAQPGARPIRGRPAGQLGLLASSPRCW